MDSHIDTAVQWIYNQVKVMLRAAERVVQGRSRTRQGREKQAAALDSEWVGMCWDIGHGLVMMQAHGIPANTVIDAVAERLRAEFPKVPDLDVGGFVRMRQFYLDYFERPHLIARLREVSWTCHQLIQQRCRDPRQQEFYLDLCASRKLDKEGLAEALKKRAYEMSAAPAPEGVPEAEESLAGSEPSGPSA